MALSLGYTLDTPRELKNPHPLGARPRLIGSVLEVGPRQASVGFSGLPDVSNEQLRQRTIDVELSPGTTAKEAGKFSI